MRTLVCVSLFGFALVFAPFANSQVLDDDTAFAVEDWLGSNQQAYRLANEEKDDEWALPREQRLAFELQKLEQLVLSNSVVECRTTICGVVFDFRVVDPLSLDTDQIAGGEASSFDASSYISDTLNVSFRRYDMSVSERVETREIDGQTTGKVELTATDMCRTGISRDPGCDN